jgi:hypothetical protein
MTLRMQRRKRKIIQHRKKLLRTKLLIGPCGPKVNTKMLKKKKMKLKKECMKIITEKVLIT